MNLAKSNKKFKSEARKSRDRFASPFLVSNSFFAANPIFTPILVAGYSDLWSTTNEELIEEILENKAD